MRLAVGFITILFFLFYSPFPVLAAVTFTLSNPQKNGDEVVFEVSINGLTSSSCPNTTCFLQAALTPQTITHYFGYTKNHNGEWFEYISSPETDYIRSTFFAFEPKGSSWSGTLTIRPNVTDSNYIGINTYDIKSWRYTGNSKSYSGSSDNVISIELIAPTPTPTNTPTPTSIPTPTPTSSLTGTSTPTPTKTPTPTPNRTPTPTLKPLMSPASREALPTGVLGENTQGGSLISQVDGILPAGDVLSSDTAKKPDTVFQGILMILGIVLITICVIFTLKTIKKGELTQDEEE